MTEVPEIDSMNIQRKQSLGMAFYGIRCFDLNSADQPTLFATSGTFDM